MTNGDDDLYHRTILHKLLRYNLNYFHHFLHDLRIFAGFLIECWSGRNFVKKVRSRRA